jgi:hypothetical protein
VGAAGRFMTLIAPVERIVWLKKQSSFGSWIWRLQQFQWQKKFY